MVAAVAYLKKGRPWLGGMALGYAAMLRIFPGLLAAGPVAAVIALAAGGAARRPEVRAHSFASLLVFGGLLIAFGREAPGITSGALSKTRPSAAKPSVWP